VGERREAHDENRRKGEQRRGERDERKRRDRSREHEITELVGKNKGDTTKS